MEAAAATHSEATSTVEIVVNNRQVLMPRHQATGLQIKEAAIRQGVPIQPDFVLFRITAHGQEQVRNEQEIELHRDEHFRAVDRDDNS